jgi:hypothetical protein
MLLLLEVRNWLYISCLDSVRALMNKRRALVFVLMVLVVAGAHRAWAHRAGDFELIELSGKVTDSSSHPVAGAQIRVRDKDAGKVYEVRSNRHGAFAVAHERTPFMSLAVSAPDKLGLAQFALNDISGEDTQHVIVQLRQGFVVRGRVSDVSGRGLNGLDIKIKAPDDDAHAGGVTKTGKDGSFKLVLTPGAKVLEISNKHFDDCAALERTHVTVTADIVLPDIVIPPRGTSH